MTMEKDITTEQAIEAVLEQIRPYLKEDGGDVELVRYEADTHIVEIRLLGNCKTCPMAGMTLRGGIERMLIAQIPSIKRIESVP